jgi:hypothetical protein
MENNEITDEDIIKQVKKNQNYQSNMGILIAIVVAGILLYLHHIKMIN